MSLLELFNQSMQRFEDQKEPITFALATVIQKKIDESLDKEYEEFDQWFRQTFYSEGSQRVILGCLLLTNHQSYLR